MTTNTPNLKTERLVLRRFCHHDTQAYFEIMRDGQANAFLPWLPLGTKEEAEADLEERYLSTYLREKGFRYAICLGADDVPIGYVHVGDSDSYDFGYGLRHEFWHRGIATEACRGVIEELKKAGIPYITATHDVNNPRSGSVMKKLGMTYCYSYQEQWQPKDIPVIFRMYQLNFDGQQGRVYQKYWQCNPVHFIEENV